MDWIINMAIGTLSVICRHARAVHGPTVPVAFYQIGIGDECLTKSHHVRAVLLDGACRRSPIEADVIVHRSVEQRPDRSEDIPFDAVVADMERSEEHTSELQSLMRISYAVFCLKKKNNNTKLKPHL